MAELQNHHPAHEAHDDPHAGHPTAKFYIVIGAILTIITAVEVAIFYIPALAGVLVPTLLVLSLGKFVLVVMYYMHLKMDSRVFTFVFVAPLILAVLVVISLIMLFKVLPTYDVYNVFGK